MDAARRRFSQFGLHNSLLALVVLVALTVRVYGIGFPLYHWDERLSFTDVFFAMGNNLSMLTYEHGSLLTYILLLIWSPIVAVAQKGFPGFYEFFLAYYQNPLLLAVPGRLISSFASVGTVVCVYFLGRRLYHRTVGLIAAFFLALTFLEVAESHYMRTYALTSLFAILAVFFSVKILDERGLKNYVLAGLFVGIATAAQYTVVFVVVPLVTAHVIVIWRNWGASAWRHLFSRSIIAGLDSAGLAFFLVTPYALLEFPAFAGYMKWFVLNRAGTAWVSPEGRPVWLFYLSEHLAGGMGVELEIVAILGLALALYRRRPHDLVLLEFPLLLFLTLNGGPNFARYAVPLLPFLMIVAANLVYSMSEWWSRWLRPQLSVLVLVIVTFGLATPSILNVLRFDFYLTQPDTRSLAAEWVQENVRSGSKIATEGLDILGPYIPPTRSRIDAAMGKSGTESEREEMRALGTSLAGRPGYQVTQLFRLDQNVRGGVVVAEVPSARAYADEGIDYLVTVSWMKRTADEEYSDAFQQSLDAAYSPVTQIRPTILFRFDPYAWRTDYDALSRVTPGVPQVGGPLLTIYRRVEIQP